MGTTADKLAKLAATKAELRQAILEKGQNAGEVFSEYPAAVRAIETGLPDFKKHDDFPAFYTELFNPYFDTPYEGIEGLIIAHIPASSPWFISAKYTPVDFFIPVPCGQIVNDGFTYLVTSNLDRGGGNTFTYRTGSGYLFYIDVVSSINTAPRYTAYAYQKSQDSDWYSIPDSANVELTFITYKSLG